MTERTFTITLQDSEKRTGKGVVTVFTESQLRRSERLSDMLTQLLVVEENAAVERLSIGGQS